MGVCFAQSYVGSPIFENDTRGAVVSLLKFPLAIVNAVCYNRISRWSLVLGDTVAL